VKPREIGTHARADKSANFQYGREAARSGLIELVPEL